MIAAMDPFLETTLDRRRFHLLSLGAAGATLAAPLPTLAQGIPGRPLVLGMTLEPPGLDPTTGAAAAIGEIMLYNVLEPLTKVAEDGSAQPLLALRWSASPDQRTWTFVLRPGVRFHDGTLLDAAAVKARFEASAAPGGQNKDRRVFANIVAIATPDPLTVVLTLKQPEPELPALLGQATAVITKPGPAGRDAPASAPVGTGPYVVAQWQRGASLTLAAWPTFRDAAAIRIPRVQFRFIGEPAAQVASLLAGDVDVFPRVAAARALAQFKAQPKRFQVITASSRAKTILAMNHLRPALQDVRVRRAIAMAIDRKAVIQASADGYGVPIGSFVTPDTPGYVDCTAINAYDPAAAKALLAQAKVSGLRLSLKLPPVPYARQGGELIASQLAAVGITVAIEQIEWAQWLSGVYANRAYDLTIISHVEPHDFGNFARADYYWGYRSEQFNALYDRMQNAADPAQRAKLFGEAQRKVAEDAVAAFLYQPQWITVARAGLKGLWTRTPLFANDLSTLSWA
jgi:peptide/nickel transport system substrate-binding protein